MTDKEQIMIDGVDVSECEYLTYQLEEDGQYHWFCKISPTGGPDECEYNPECFYKRVLKQLACKTQECEELKEELHLYKTFYRAKHGDVKNYLGRYRKALEEIEAVCRADTYTFADGTQVRYDSLDGILDIINKAKGEMNG